MHDEKEKSRNGGRPTVLEMAKGLAFGCLLTLLMPFLLIGHCIWRVFSRIAIARRASAIQRLERDGGKPADWQKFKHFVIREEQWGIISVVGVCEEMNVRVVGWAGLDSEGRRTEIDRVLAEVSDKQAILPAWFFSERGRDVVRRAYETKDPQYDYLFADEVPVLIDMRSIKSTGSDRDFRAMEADCARGR